MSVCTFIASNYPLTEVAPKLNNPPKMVHRSTEFAKRLYNIPLPNRYQWLEDIVDNSLRELGASFSDYNDVMFFLEQLKGAI